MFDLNSIQATPLQKVYREARRTAGKRAVEMVLVAHGARAAHLQEVPEANRAKCLAALKKLIDNENAGTDAKRVDDADDGDAFDDIRSKAYGTRERPKPPQKLDPVGIFKRWNSTVRPNED